MDGILLDTMNVFDNIKLELYKFDAKDIIFKLDVWSFNRQLNQEHVDEIYKDLCSQTKPYLIGTLKVIKDASNEMKVIDGQHRLQALKKYILTYTTAFPIFIEIYNVVSFDDEIVIKLFKLANKNLNVNVDEDLNMFVVELVNKLASDPELSRGIIDKNDGRVLRPRISKKELYEALKSNLKIHHLNQSIDDIVVKIKEVNYHISNMSYLQLYSRREPCQKKINVMQRDINSI